MSFRWLKLNRHLDASLETIFLCPVRSISLQFTTDQTGAPIWELENKGLVLRNVRLALKERSGVTGE